MSEYDPTDDVVLDGFPYEKAGDESRGRETIEFLATEFLERERLGQHPSIEEYVRKYPHVAEQIREFFPMVSAMERWKRDKESTCLRRRIPEDFTVERLGDCRIIREIGRGGMGIVFEAEQDELHRRVAVKLLPWRAADVPKSRDRFRREAQMLSKLRHPNIVPLFSFGEYDDFYYYVMPYIRGVGLDWVLERLRETDGVVYAEEIVRRRGSAAAPSTADSEWHLKHPSPHQHRSLRRGAWKQTAMVGLQVANALRYAHARRILHNDIKPGNLLLDSDGRVWVTDFGLAQSLDADAMGVDDSVAGTIRYMPPERFVGAGDERSDIYSLGITLYELTTLVPAYDGTNPEQLMKQVTQTEPVDPRSRNPDIPRDLEAIILTAIATDPDRRYQTAADFASDLLRFLNGKPPRIARPGLFRRIARLFGR